jgi:hypothetical protein
MRRCVVIRSDLSLTEFAVVVVLTGIGAVLFLAIVAVMWGIVAAVFGG